MPLLIFLNFKGLITSPSSHKQDDMPAQKKNLDNNKATAVKKTVPAKAAAPAFSSFRSRIVQKALQKPLR